MNASIINVGNEVIEGDVLNTNAQYISKVLNEFGIKVKYQFACNDEVEDLVDVINFLKDKTDLIITTGGLGPTADDLTKETVVEAFGLTLEKNDDILINIQNKFKKFNTQMTENNIKQAYSIKGARVLMNEAGTAPGYFVVDTTPMVLLLPGPPRELKPIVEKKVKKYLQEYFASEYHSQFIQIVGIGESSVETEIRSKIKSDHVYIGTYAAYGLVTIKLSSNGYRDELISCTEKIKKMFKGNIVSYEKKELSTLVVDEMIKRRITIATAESCTGGLLASTIVKESGVSKIYNGGVIAYSNQKKEELLYVASTTLERYGAVSEATAREMVEGLSKLFQTDLCISVTGIAGPNGGSEEKPVGLVYIGFKLHHSIEIHKKNFTGTRHEIQNKVVNYIFRELSRKILVDK